MSSILAALYQACSAVLILELGGIKDVIVFSSSTVFTRYLGG